MKKDGLVPIAFGDKDGWPAMGTFDQLNMRINGYDFHVSLMAGKEAWTDPKVKKVFDTWSRPAALPPGRLARPHLAGGGAVAAAEEVRHVPARHRSSRQQFTKGAEQDDLDFFTFPEIDSTIGTDAIEAPIDGFMMAPSAEERGRRQEAARVPRPSPRRRTSTLKADPSVIAANSKADTSGYTALQKKSAEFVGRPSTIAQFLDRDTRPDFASTVMIPALQTLHQEPEGHRRPRCTSIENQKKTHLRVPDGQRETTDAAEATRAGTSTRPHRPAGRDQLRQAGSSCSPDGRRADACIVAVARLARRRSARSLLSFTNWDGIGAARRIKWVGLQNYRDVVTIYPPFWPAIQHNLIWLVVLVPRRDAARHVPRRAARQGDARAAGSTRPRSTCRSCCRWRSSASSGS